MIEGVVNAAYEPIVVLADAADTDSSRRYADAGPPQPEHRRRGWRPRYHPGHRIAGLLLLPSLYIVHRTSLAKRSTQSTMPSVRRHRFIEDTPCVLTRTDRSGFSPQPEWPQTAISVHAVCRKDAWHRAAEPFRQPAAARCQTPRSPAARPRAAAEPAPRQRK